MAEFTNKPGKTTDVREANGEVRGGDDGGHLDHELNHVDDEYSPKPGMCRENHVQQADAEQRLPARDAEQYRRDLAGGKVDRAHDDAVEEQPEVDSPETTNHGRGSAGVTDLVELVVR